MSDQIQKQFEEQEATEKQPESTELAPVLETKHEIELGQNGLELQTMNDLWRFGTCVVNSGMAPKGVTKIEQVVMRVQYGMEVGLSAMQALQGVAVINNVASLWGDALKGVVLNSPLCEWITESLDGEGMDMVATCTSKRRGAPESLSYSFSVKDAQQAGLWDKAGTWQQYPKRQLQMRARGFNLRDNFADVLKGLISAEEAMDYPSTEPKRIQEGDEVGASDLDQLAETAEAVELPEVSK